MTLLQIASALVVLAALFGVVNHLTLRLPTSIGILVVSLAASILVLAVDALSPELTIAETMRTNVLALDFSETLLEGMLGLLLFAGALHVPLRQLKENWRVVLLMATLGVALSVAVVGGGLHLLLGVPLVLALVFGAIVTPTDPVAVMGVLKEVGLRKDLEVKIAGESLFNDGVAYVVFLILVGLAFPAADVPHVSGLEGAVILFLQEAVGGVVLGLLGGVLTWRLMRRVNDPVLEVMLTLALALGGYQLAVALHVSAPIAAVCAGLLIGHEERGGVTRPGREQIDTFWKLIDEILNAILFLMIGVEVFAIAFPAEHLLAGLLAIVLALVARLVAVAVPLFMLRPFRGFGPGVIPIMTWGGLKGGISVALALSLPDSETTELILTATYVVVIFSILVQGLTVGRVAQRLGPEPEML